jgi:hypothetical protein
LIETTSPAWRDMKLDHASLVPLQFLTGHEDSIEVKVTA